MQNDENLIPPKKGEPSRNPNGRPKGSLNRSTVARQYLAMMAILPVSEHEDLVDVFPKVKQKLTVEELITLSQISRASKGDTNAYKAVMDSAYGAPKQQIEMDRVIVPGKIEL